jgi:glucose-6-phosphate isomerase
MSGMNIQHIDTSGVTDEELQTHISRLSGYRDKLKQVRNESAYNTPESLLRLPEDKAISLEAHTVAQNLNAEKLTDVIVVGIGGSVRGLRAVYDLLAGDSSVRLHTINSMSSSDIEKTVSFISQRVEKLSQVAVCIVSKSGRTIETVSNANVLLRRLAEVFPTEDIASRTVVVTQSGNKLAELAKDKKMLSVNIPEQISGRFSVFSAVGMVPLQLLGIDTESLRAGAEKMLGVCLSGRATADPAAALAAILYTHTENNVRILNHCFFTPKARSLGDWVKQLFAESLGKRENRRGEPVFSGLYPVTTIAPGDLHADLQLQMGGAKNFFTIFLQSQAVEGADYHISEEGLLSEDSAGLAGKGLAEVRQKIGVAVMDAFREAGRPFVSITVDNFSPARVGQLLLLEELVVMYLADLMEVNAFNQPQINDYKKELHKLLEL